MSDADAILRAILEAPTDDAPRLIFADVIEESDPSRAAFIRASVEMSHYTDCPVRLSDAARGRPVPHRCGECGYCKARKVSERLIGEVSWSAWGLSAVGYSVCVDIGFGGSPDGHLVWPHFEIRRGLIYGVHATLEAFGDHAERLFSAHPVERAIIYDKEPEDWHIGGEGHRVSGFRWAASYGTWIGGEMGGPLPLEPSELPASLHKYLGGSGVGPWHYRSAEEAKADLNMAVVKMARSRLKLPPLGVCNPPELVSA